MEEFDRRSALKLGLLASVAAAAPTAAAAQGLYSQTLDLRRDLDAGAGPPAIATSTDSNRNPVLFWNGVGLDLVALDHSLRPEDSRAPGPCATAWALGLVQAAIADAVHYAFANSDTPAAYQPQLKKEAYTPPSFEPKLSIDGTRELFVAGAAAGLLSHIYSTPAHVQLIEFRRQEFFTQFNVPAAVPDFEAWQSGLAFTNPRNAEGQPVGSDYTRRWVWEGRNGIRRKLVPPEATYIPRPRGHNVDPYNWVTGFYGELWGEQPPLVLETSEPADPYLPAPPAEDTPEYVMDLEQVQRDGAAPMPGQDKFDDKVRVGLFWAYDGARLIGTPPRLYNQILRNIAGSDGLNVPEMARLFALCNMAMADAGIIAWKAKYQYNVWRPVLGIQNRLDESQSDRCWRPYGAPKTNPPGAGTQAPPDARPAAGDTVAEAQSLFSAADAGAPELASTQSLLGAGPFRVTPRAVEGADAEPAAAPMDGGCDYSRDTEPSFTPNFPAYPSGHATFGTACFRTLRKFRRAHFRKKDPGLAAGAPAMPDEEETDLASNLAKASDNVAEALAGFTSDELNGISLDPYTLKPRRNVIVNPDQDSAPANRYDLPTITKMIEDNNVSRVYLGVHWRFDATRGAEAGARIAREVFDRAYKDT